MGTDLNISRLVQVIKFFWRNRSGIVFKVITRTHADGNFSKAAEQKTPILQ